MKIEEIAGLGIGSEPRLLVRHFSKTMHLAWAHSDQMLIGDEVVDF